MGASFCRQERGAGLDCEGATVFTAKGRSATSSIMIDGSISHATTLKDSLVHSTVRDALLAPGRVELVVALGRLLYRLGLAINSTSTICESL